MVVTTHHADRAKEHHDDRAEINMATEQTILITGITGKQGGAVARSLKGGGFRLRGMTRKPDSDRAKALKSDGVEIVAGDLDDASSLGKALAGAWGVFAVQNTWEAGVEKEEEQGKRQARLAREAGVQHYVYSSVGSAHKKTGIPHFDNKWRIEETVRELKFPSHVVLRPVFFMENLLTPGTLNGDTLALALKPETRLQMIAVDDIGRYGARAFTDAAGLNGRAIDLAGDEITAPAAAAVLSKALGREITFVSVPNDQVRKFSEDAAIMFDWFNRIGYSADIAALEREFGFTPMTLPEWASANAR
jgi:uncharacterized protein YbjT (DUF2867 family)